MMFKTLGLLLFSGSLVACQAADSLSNLGSGAFAAPPDTMTVKITGYTPQSGQTFNDIFAANFSVQAYAGALHWSTARDGMPDSLKQALQPTYGFLPTSPESVVPGFQDLLLYQAGITTIQQSQMYCSSVQLINSANDAFIYNDSRYSGSPQTFLGLRDCDKLYMGLNPATFDYNKNGIPDYLEIRCGMNPLSTDEAFLSTAGDGVENITKCKENIPIGESASTQPNQLFAYHYDSQLQSDGTVTFTISNIPILNGGEGNFLTFSITETNLTTSAPALYTAYAIIKAGYAGKTLQFSYWATSPTTLDGQEIAVP